MHPFPAARAITVILSPNTPNADGTYTDPLVDLGLGSDDDGSREPRHAKSVAIGLRNAHDADTLHLICGPQYPHDHVERPVAAINRRHRHLELQAQLSTEKHLLPEPASDDVRVRHEWVWEDNFVAITRLWLERLRKRLIVKYKGEDALDYGSVSRERLFLLLHEHLDYFKFINRVLPAVFHNRFLDAYFVSGFYKTILNKKTSMLQSTIGLTWMLEGDIIGVLDETPLLDRRPHIVIDLVVIFRVFDEHEHELLIGGMAEIAIGDWMRFTDYRGYDKTDQVIEWFLVCLRSWPAESKALLLQFTTGTSRVPINVLKRLQGGDRPCRFTVERSGDANGLLRSHTCLNHPDLRPYEGYESLERKHFFVIECISFFAWLCSLTEVCLFV
ncbi:hypothetical protein BJY52DRAFT_1192866 [Lactarius psammicola]|nr:hypothetical protein BJY52DRAFT_1192866 [Lactarius psammicola]